MRRASRTPRRSSSTKRVVVVASKQNWVTTRGDGAGCPLELRERKARRVRREVAHALGMAAPLTASKPSLQRVRPSSARLSENGRREAAAVYAVCGVVAGRRRAR